MKCSWLWLLLMLFCCSSVAQAAIRIDDLYEISVPVVDKSIGERNQAMAKALHEVLVRVSGLSTIGQHPELASAGKNAAHYVQQYLYKKQVQDVSPGGEEPRATELFLWVRFDEKLIKQLLMANNMPIWGVARPATLIWLAVDDLGDRFLLGNEKGAALIEDLNTNARRRGLPLLYPLHDLEDQMHVGFVDVWGGFAGAIRKASSRYNVEAILAGRLYRDRLGGWKARWSLFDANGEQQWSAGAEDPSVLLASTVDSIADVLGEQYAIYGNDQQQAEVMLTVYGVENLQDYARLSHYLQENNSITKAYVREIDADTALYALEIRGDVAGVERTFALENVLTPEQRRMMPEVARQPPAVQEVSLPKQPAPVVREIPVQMPTNQLYYRLVQVKTP